MNLIVSTYYSILICNEKGEILWELPEDKTGHYGITWNETEMFILCADAQRTDGQNQWVTILDRDLKPVGSLFHEDLQAIIGVHQIQWWDDLLWICSTSHGRIVCCGRGGGEFRWKPKTDVSPPKAHINSIWFESDMVHLVHHTFGKCPAIFTYSYPSLEFEYKTPLRSVPHNVYRHEGDLVSLLIGEVFVEGSNEEVGTPGYHIHKGLAAYAEGLVFGASIVQDRGARHKEAQGCLYFCDNDWGFLRSVNLQHGPINEVRILDQPDFAHHSMPWTGRFGA